MIRIDQTSLIWIFMLINSGTCVITGNVTCDNIMEFYADGVLVDYSDKWFQVSSITIPDSTNTLAFRCVDSGVIAGIKGAFDNGIKTNATWKCLPSFQEGWNLPGFDDSSWPAAVLPDPTIWGTNPSELNGVADWIWTAGGISDSVVYCRIALGEYDATATLEGCADQLMPLLETLQAGINALNVPLNANVTTQIGQVSTLISGLSTFVNTSIIQALNLINAKVNFAETVIDFD